jgi:Bacterial Ig-like domain (group 3)
MSPRKNSASCRWIFDSLGFSLVYRMLAQAVRLAGAASLFVGIATSGAASAQTKAATVTSLSVSASSLAASTVVTLTAKVTAGGANVSPGQVNFCDATAAYCIDIHILATAQLTSSGTATYKFRPAIGSHSYKALFVGIRRNARRLSPSRPYQPKLATSRRSPPMDFMGYRKIASTCPISMSMIDPSPPNRAAQRDCTLGAERPLGRLSGGGVVREHGDSGPFVG